MMKKAGLIFLIFAAITIIPSVMVLAGGPASDRGVVKSQESLPPIPARGKGEFSKEEQIRLSSKEFIKIYELTQEKDRSANLEKIISKYYLIINQYPDAPLAEESYWHLIQLMLDDFKPPRKDKAVELFDTFAANYPDSPFKNIIADTLMRFYYRNQFWDDLLKMTAPYINETNTTAALKMPVPIFFYAEAAFHLADLQEATRGYDLIINSFPDTRMARIAKERMRDIRQSDK
jgi:hypothetical protein